ncbi:Bifunctional protein [subsurface metagenome]
MRKLTEQIIIYTDGGSRGNPGPSAASFILTDSAGIRLQVKGIFIGHATCNVAEYTGIVKALESAKQIGAKQVLVFSDSLLLVNQINGQWKVKSRNLEDLYRRAIELLRTFEGWEVVHVRRHKNADADALVNLALDREKDVN